MTKVKALFALILAIGVALPVSSSAANKTLQNLQSAYNGESNAHAKYLEFAKQADKEGYVKVGSLFRAAAAAEQIHRTCEAAVIRRMGATPKADIKLPPIKSTKENLEESANKGEAHEFVTMYPSFIRQASHDNNRRAAQCFKWARAAELEHFKLFNAAVHHLDQMKGGPETYYVCTKGGYTMAKLDKAKCPGGEYEEIK